MYLSEPRGFKDPAAVKARLALLATPEAQLLKEFAAEIESRRNAVVPHFDPFEGGVGSRILLVHDAPGPMTNGGNAPGLQFHLLRQR